MAGICLFFLLPALAFAEKKLPFQRNEEPIKIMSDKLHTDSSRKMATFTGNVAAMAAKIKSTRRLPGVDEIFVPGEREEQLARQCLESGEIEIEDNLLEGLRLAAQQK